MRRPVVIGMLVITGSALAFGSYTAVERHRKGSTNSYESMVDIEDSDPVRKEWLLREYRQKGLLTQQCREIALRSIRSHDQELALESILTLRMSRDRKDLEKLLQAYVDFTEHPDSLLMRDPPVPIVGLNIANAYERLSMELSMSLRSVAKVAPDLLEPLLESQNPKFRLDAAVAFAYELDVRAVPVLVDILRSSKDWRQRQEAAVALGTVGLRLSGRQRDEVVFALKEAMNDKHTEQGWGGAYRPVVTSACVSLRCLGVEVKEPADIMYVPHEL
jgi:hypothetical protein